MITVKSRPDVFHVFEELKKEACKLVLKNL